MTSALLATTPVPLWQTWAFWIALAIYLAGALSMGLLLLAWVAIDEWRERAREDREQRAVNQLFWGHE